MNEQTSLKQPSLKIEGARFLVTMDPQRRIIRDGAVLVEDQRITRVGKTTELAGIAAERVIDARQMVVTPGFVNGHIHISYAHAVRGIFPDDLGPAYLPNVFRLQGAMTPDEEYRTSLLAITELLKYGTTCFLDPGSAKHLDACRPAYERSGCRIIVGTQVVDRPNPLNLPVTSTDAAIRSMEDTIRAYDRLLDGRVRAWAMPFAPMYSSPELLASAKRLADEHGTGMTTHYNYSTQAVAEWMQEHGRRPVDYLAYLGVLGPNVVLAHALGLHES